MQLGELGACAENVQEVCSVEADIFQPQSFDHAEVRGQLFASVLGHLEHGAAEVEGQTLDLVQPRQDGRQFGVVHVGIDRDGQFADAECDVGGVLQQLDEADVFRLARAMGEADGVEDKTADDGEEIMTSQSTGSEGGAVVSKAVEDVLPYFWR
ncbi:uncharacterized protein FIBRA_07585 [Fibroporia radiculosa]|uniref:Uncharacterized protein n=1 Tax=Fibroporia radiculosa TaxID=599839 RepID=J4GV97_9APHY|nr:uncharacterized protein FIBRA_07585 [Fibroporia radiculosa]CCM05370.1 predicted protein [Fibroporia radiculosa]